MNENLELETTNDFPESENANITQKEPSRYDNFYEWTHKAQARLFLTVCQIFGFIFTCFIFVFQVVLTPISVVGASMQPTINVNAAGATYNINTDIVYYYQYESYTYKDIVIIEGNYAQGVDKIIKRVIATPGQTIRFEVEKRLTSPYSSINLWRISAIYSFIFINITQIIIPCI